MVRFCGPCRMVLLPALLLCWSPAAGGAECLEIRTPRRLVVEPGKAYPVRVRLRAGKLAGIGARHGRLLPRGPTSGQVIVFDYRPPETTTPLLEVITAESSAPGCHPRFAVLALQVRRILRAQVVANSRVSARVGRRRYGPVRAAADGRVEIPVVQAPGENRAELLVTPLSGRSQRRILELTKTASARLVWLVKPRRLKADGDSRASLYLFLASSHPLPARLPPPRLTASSGQVTRPTYLGRGVFVAGYQAPRNLFGGRETITARLPRPWSLRSTTKLRLLPGKQLRLQLESERQQLVADGEKQIQLTITVRDAGQQPVERAPLQLEATAGRLGPVRERGGGIYEVELVAPLAPAPETTRITASLGPFSTSLELPLRPPQPLSLAVEPAEVVAGSEPGALVTVRAFGSDQGTPRRVRLRSSLGRLPDELLLTGTRASARLLPGTRAGRATVEARWGRHRASATLHIRPGPPARIAMATSQTHLVTGSGASLPFAIRITDVFGNPVPGVQLAVTCSRGRVYLEEENVGGLRHGIYQPPAEAAGPVQVRAVAPGGASGELTLMLLEPPSRLGLVVAGGLEHNLARLGAAEIMVQGQLRLLGNLFLELGLLYFGTSISAACSAGPADCSGDLRLDGIPLELSLGWRHENGSAWTPFFSAGAGALVTRLEASSSQQRAVEVAVNPSLHLRAGLELELGPGGICLDLGWRYAPWLGSRLASGTLGGLFARLGYRFAL